MSHNYYLYGRGDGGGRLQWIPWDHTFAFSAGGVAGEDGGVLGGGDVSTTCGRSAVRLYDRALAGAETLGQSGDELIDGLAFAG